MIVAVLGAAAALATPASATVHLRAYASGFASPTYVTATRTEPSRLYVVEQPGRIRYLVRGRLAGTFLDIRSRVSSGGERGLLSVAFSPGYARNHRFYVDYTDRNGDTRVVQYRSDGTRAIPGSAHQLLFESAGRQNYDRNVGNYWVFEGLGTYFETVEFAAEFRVNGGGPQALPPIRHTYETDFRVQELQPVLTQH